jgi:hypothetical protein
MGIEAENHKRQCPNAKETGITGWQFEISLGHGVLGFGV